MRVLVAGATRFVGGGWFATPVDAGVAEPLVESLAGDTVVTDPAPASLFDVRPIGSAEALRRARAEALADAGEA
jgi:hypothetical protein